MMALVRVCDACGAAIHTEGPLREESWVQVAIALDESVRDGGTCKDYHRKCARTVTLAEVWKRSGLVDL